MDKHEMNIYSQMTFCKFFKVERIISSSFIEYVKTNLEKSNILQKKIKNRAAQQPKK